jgi:hypothetical protein
MHKILIIILAFFSIALAPIPEEHAGSKEWNILLNDVRMRYRYSVQFNSFVQVPRFGNAVKALDGKEVVLTGFFLPADITGEAFVLSHVPMQMCFFCAGSGIESVVELRSNVSNRIRFRRLKTDDFIEVKGTLRLNADNPDQLIYFLEEAELVRVIR